MVIGFDEFLGFIGSDVLSVFFIGKVLQSEKTYNFCSSGF